MKNFTSHTIETLLASQGVPLAAGRGERLAAGVNDLYVPDPLRAELGFDVDPTTYLKTRNQP